MLKHSELGRGGTSKGQERDSSGSGLCERSRAFVGQRFCVRFYFASTIERDGAVIRESIKNQEKEDQRLDHLNLWR